MLIKWIRCHVLAQNKERFGIAQARWNKLQGLPGFLGQAGGWNTQNPLEACIVTFWKDEQSYHHFMKDFHDVIFAQTEQKDTYSDISVRLYKGSCKHEDDANQVFAEWLESAIQRYPVMVVSQGVDESLSWREEAFLLATGQSDSDPDEIIHIWLDLAPVCTPPLKTTSFPLEKAWLVL